MKKLYYHSSQIIPISNKNFPLTMSLLLTLKDREEPPYILHSFKISLLRYTDEEYSKYFYANMKNLNTLDNFISTVLRVVGKFDSNFFKKKKKNDKTKYVHTKLFGKLIREMITYERKVGITSLALEKAIELNRSGRKYISDKTLKNYLNSPIVEIPNLLTYCNRNYYVVADEFNYKLSTSIE